jgi:hypothetical protein
MSKNQILLKSLDEFFSDDKYFMELRDILSHNSGISLRNIEWFVTNYAKDKRTTFTTPTGTNIDVHIAYKSSLGGYSKKLFDPFCRTERIEFKGLTTTVAQLNFIRWCIRNGILDYIKTRLPRNLYQSRTLNIRNSKDTDGNFQLIEVQVNQEI